MDEFAAEARQISNILNFWDFGFFVGALKKYAHENPHRRMQLVLQDYFREKDSGLFFNNTLLSKDAQTIKDIFPHTSLEEITSLLEEIGNEDNRIRIVVKKLLKKNNNVLLKRTFTGDINDDDDVVTKKTKIEEEDENNHPSTSTECTTISVDKSMPLIDEIDNTKPEEAVDSQSTITYSFDNNKDFEVTPADPDILISIIDFNVNNEKSNNESIVEQPNNNNNDVTSIENVTPATEMSKVIEDNPLQLKITNVISLNDSPSKDEEKKIETLKEEVPEIVSENLPTTSVSVPVIEAFPYTDVVPANNNLTINFVEETFQPTTFNTININLSDNAASTSEIIETEGNDTYHLYKHLMEMFTNVSRRDVKSVCQKHHIRKHQKPRDEVFSSIVSDLLELTNSSRGSTSDDSENCSNSTTIVVPHSPEGKDKLRLHFPPPLSKLQPRNFIEGPFGLVQKSNLPSVQKNALEMPNAPQSINRPDNDNRVNFMLKDILSGLMETASDSEEEDILAADNEVEEVEHDNRLIYPLMEMFPEACPQFIRRICKGKTNAPGVLDDLISQILENDYPKRVKAESPTQKMDPEEQLEMLKQILPDADPSYLQLHCDRLINKPEELKVFIANAVENRDYPKLKDYLRRQQVSAQQKQYTTEFNVENFLEVIPDPSTYFEDRKQSTTDYESQHYAICFFRNHFSKVQLRAIRETYKQNSLSILRTFKALEHIKPSLYMKSKRPPTRMPEVIQNIPLLQEIAYVEHRDEIELYLQQQKVREEEERAAAVGLMQTCSCCFDDEVMPKHIFTCENGCIFCKECVQRGAEVSFGDGKLDFACLNNCSSHFSLQTLQAVLKPKLFSKIAIKKQLEEVKAAGIEDLEMCPFCDFATIPAKEDKLFRCLNPDCMKESCRLCKEPSHVPLRCEEVEKDDDVKIRTYIENKMTEALLRTCYKCNKKFIKEEGCNKMTCACGALMCYICGKPVSDYKHFNGAGGDRFDLCPLYSDTNHLHEEAVLKGAEQAKKEVGLDANSGKLKIDPAADVQKHYKEIAQKHPAPPVFPYVNPFMIPADNPQLQQRRDNLLLIHQRFRDEERERRVRREQERYFRHLHHHHHHHN